MSVTWRLIMTTVLLVSFALSQSQHQQNGSTLTEETSVILQEDLITLNRLESKMRLLLPDENVIPGSDWSTRCGDEGLIPCLMKEMNAVRDEVAEMRKEFAEMKAYCKQELNPIHAEITVPTAISGHGGETEEELTLEANTTTITSAEVTGQGPSCPPEFQVFDNTCYFINNLNRGSVDAARNHCRSLGGDLAHPPDMASLTNHLAQQFNFGIDFWIDGHYVSTEAVWRWTNGELIDESVWGIEGAANSSRRHEGCVLLKKRLQFLADPQNCRYQYSYICQAPLQQSD